MPLFGQSLTKIRWSYLRRRSGGSVFFYEPHHTEHIKTAHRTPTPPQILLLIPQTASFDRNRTEPRYYPWPSGTKADLCSYLKAKKTSFAKIMGVFTSLLHITSVVQTRNRKRTNRLFLGHIANHKNRTENRTANRKTRPKPHRCAVWCGTVCNFTCSNASTTLAKPLKIRKTKFFCMRRSIAVLDEGPRSR